MFGTTEGEYIYENGYIFFLVVNGEATQCFQLLALHDPGLELQSQKISRFIENENHTIKNDTKNELKPDNKHTKGKRAITHTNVTLLRY